MEKKMYIETLDECGLTIGATPCPLAAEEGEDTPICSTCKGNKTINGQFCPNCHGTGYSDRQPLRLEEIDADEVDCWPGDDNEDDGEESVSDEVSLPRPHCGKDLKVTVTVH